MLGLFALNPNGINGAVMQMVSHGIYSGALFLLVGIIYERRHTRNVAEFGGLSHVMPGYAAVFLAMTMTAIGLPLLADFISEFLAMRGAFEANPFWAGWRQRPGIIASAAKVPSTSPRDQPKIFPRTGSSQLCAIVNPFQ